MLVLKAIFKVIGQVIGGLFLGIMILVVFIGGIWLFTEGFKLLGGLMASIFGDGWTAFCGVFSTGALWVLGGVLVLMVIAMFVTCVYDEYCKLAAKAGCKKGGADEVLDEGDMAVD